jgi:hypothetical protein
MKHTVVGAIKPSMQWVPGSFPGVSGRGVKTTTHLHLIFRLRMSGAVSVLPLYAFMARSEQTLLFFHTAGSKWITLFCQNVITLTKL